MGCALLAGLAIMGSGLGCGQGSVASTTAGARPARVSAASLGPLTARVAAAGDVACASATSAPGCRAADTADLLDRLRPSSLLVLGDLAYEYGSADEFANGYAGTWGRFKQISFPVPGNHEYRTSGASAYRDWWGRIATPDGNTWHSTRIGGWLVIGLDSNCDEVGGCDLNSPQGRWLAAQLRGSPRCVLAIWHHPRRSSGPHGDNPSMSVFWAMLARAHADLVLAGHDHDYERFAPADASANPARPGMTGIVVGTGGKSLYPFGRLSAGSAFRVQGVNGVLMLGLHTRGWEWRFVGTDGRSRDSGSATCRA